MPIDLVANGVILPQQFGGENAMLSSPAFVLGTPATRRERRAITTVREFTNGAPCLGVALGLACLVWVGIGSAVALVLH